MSAETHNIKEEVKKYFMVFGALMVLTIITVAAAGLKVGLAVGITIALIIASVKATLVAGYFMHLVSEKPSIYAIVISAAFLFISMIGLIIYGYYDVPEGTRESSYTPKTIQSTLTSEEHQTIGDEINVEEGHH